MCFLTLVFVAKHTLEVMDQQWPQHLFFFGLVEVIRSRQQWRFELLAIGLGATATILLRSELHRLPVPISRTDSLEANVFLVPRA